jgi:hypothetical protein
MTLKSARCERYEEAFGEAACFALSRRRVDGGVAFLAMAFGGE